MKLFVVAVAALAVVSSVSAQGCDTSGGARNTTEFNACVTQISHQDFSSEKLDALTACVNQDARGYSAVQVQKLLSLFSFGSDQITALDTLQPYLLGLTCSDVVHILSAYSFSSDKLDALRAMVNVSAIVDTQNNATIIESFTFSSDQDTAKQIIAGMKPRSCVFGRVTADRVVFIVDTSGSMATGFSLNGQSYTRLSYVASQLDLVIRQQLASYQSLNVLRFSDSVTEWGPAIQRVTPASITSAVSYIASWSAGGGTNLYNAITAAYLQLNVKAIYLLSDGVPSVGVTVISAIVAKARALSQDQTIPLNTVAFLEGDSGSDDPALSKELMNSLATATGGVYRVVQKSS